MVSLQLTLFGTFQLTLDGAPITRFRSQREVALLVYLAVEARQAHPRERLAGLLWPDKPEATARQNLRQTLMNLRTLLNDDQRPIPLLLTERNTVQWNGNSSYTLDVETFRKQLAACASCPHLDLATCADCQARLSEAVALYQGPFLSNFAFSDSDLFEEWLLLTREHFQQQVLQTLSLLSASAFAQGHWAKVEQWARRQVTLDPLHEPAQRYLIQALTNKGDRGGALSHFENFAAYLQRELGVEPSPETLALIEQLRTNAPSTQPARRVSRELPPQSPSPQSPSPQSPSSRASASANIYQLAAGKLTDLLSPPPISAQSVAEAQTAPPSAHQPINPTALRDWGGTAPNSLFVGRQAEEGQVSGWLQSGVRVICLWNWAGMGKTALAQAVARSQADHFSVVIWRSVANAPSLPTLLDDWLARLGESATAGATTTLDHQLNRLFDHLRSRRTLLVLDNLEALMQPGLAGRFQPEHEIYNQFLQRFVQSDHQSVLLLASREQLELFARLEEETPLVRSLAVAGLGVTAGQQLLAAHGLSLSAAAAAPLIARFDGNPTLLQFAAHSIQDLFGGDVTAFFSQEALMYGPIRELFDHYRARLPYIEGALLIWLALACEPVPLAQLRTTLVPPIAPELATEGARYSPNGFFEAIHSLQRRGLLEQTPAGFTTVATVVQNMSSFMLELLMQEILAGKAGAGLYEVALVNPLATEETQQKQLDRLVRPLVAQIVQQLGYAGLAARLAQLETAARQAPLSTRNYLQENLATLSTYLRTRYVAAGQTEVVQLEPLVPPIAVSAAHTSPAESSASIPAVLPDQLTPIVGRERELAELIERLRQPAVRLMTLVGAGGLGKTTLALAVAQALLAEARVAPNTIYADGIFFVALAPLTSAAELPSAIATVLGLSLQGSDLSQALAQQLRHKQLLLILDNVEHLLHEAPQTAPSDSRSDRRSIHTIIDVVQSAHGVQILTTSRERLNLRGEHLYPVPPLAFAERATLAEAKTAPAVQLFVQNAQRSDTSFDLTTADLPAVVRICQLVQGMPLGLELAAAHVGLLPLAAIASEIERSAEFLAVDWHDVPERQRSLRAVFDWSWQLLNPTEQHTLRQLAIFRGGFTRAAAQQIANANLPALTNLWRKSLLQRTEANTAGSVTGERYQIHELLRQFAMEQLDNEPAAEQAVHARHALYYLQWLMAQQVDLSGPRYQATLHAVESEVGNLTAAWAWAIAQRNLDLLAAVIPSLSAYYQRRGRYQEGYAACQNLVSQLGPTPTADDAVLAVGQGLAYQGAFAIELKRLTEARALLEHSLRLLNRPAFQAASAFVYYSLGYTAALQGQLAQAHSWLERGLTLYQEHGDRLGAALTLHRLGRLAWLTGEYTQAHHWHSKSLALYRMLDDRMGAIHAISDLAMVSVLVDRVLEATQLFAEANTLIELLDDPLESAEARRRLGWLLAQVGYNQAAQEQYEICLTLITTAQEEHFRLEAYLMLSYLHLMQCHYTQALTLSQALFEHASPLGIQRDAAFGLMLQGLAGLGQGDYPQARTHLQRALALFQGISNTDDQSYALLGLSYAQRALGDSAGARQSVLTVLRDAVTSRSTRGMRLALGAYVGRLLEEQKIEQAIELESLFMAHPYHGNSLFYRHLITEPVLAQAATSLPATAITAAQRRGQTRDLIATIDELWAATQTN
ncbi:MAG: AAA family ATPase [Caldilineaceae bacterium]|nr:AAA family ATPase [Caldilineaceae bacterium]